jgi:hypothetical protein
MDIRTEEDFLEKPNESAGQKLSLHNEHGHDNEHGHKPKPSIHTLKLIFDTNNIPWLIQSMDVIRQGFYDTHGCCSLITTGCKECIKAFPQFVRDNLVYRNKVLAIFNNQDVPRHHIALSLFNYKSQALFGNMKFCSSEFSDYFYEDIRNGKYRFKDYKYMCPYASLYSYHKDDEVIGLYINRSDLVRRMGIYYLCIKGILNNNIMRVNVYDVFSMYVGGDGKKDVRNVLERLGLGNKDDVDRLVFEKGE